MFLMDTVANNGWKYDLLILCMLPLFVLLWYWHRAFLKCRSPKRGHSLCDYLRRGRTRWREEGGAESTEIYWIWSNQETVGMWCQNGLYANLVVKGELCLEMVILHFDDRCRPEMISIFNLYFGCFVVVCWWRDSLTFSLSLFNLPLARCVSFGFCPFRWTTLCVFTEGFNVVILWFIALRRIESQCDRQNATNVWCGLCE